MERMAVVGTYDFTTTVGGWRVRGRRRAISGGHYIDTPGVDTGAPPLLVSGRIGRLAEVAAEGECAGLGGIGGATGEVCDETERRGVRGVDGNGIGRHVAM